MIIRFSFVITSALLFISSISSCDNKEVDLTDLEGKWETVLAQRNGKTTQTLENVIFHFSSDSIMKTNLMGDYNSFKIQYKYPSIKLQSSQLDYLNVKEYKEDSLRLSTTISEHRYEFLLFRRN